MEKLKINLESVSVGSENCKVLASSTYSSLITVEDTRGYCSPQQIFRHVLKRRFLFALDFMDSF
jgi:hypothetical protein